VTAMWLLFALACRTDGVDSDSDGVPDQEVRSGDVWISEVMVRPGAGEGAEWIELRNTTGAALSLRGWTLGSDDGSWTIDDGAVGPYGYAVIGPVAAASEGVPLDGTVEGISLRDETGEIRVVAGDVEVGRMSWTADWPHEDGASLSADVYAEPADAADPASWCAAERLLPSGDRGTPGGPNDACPTIDHDGDGVTRAQGDCDDADPQVGPFHPELWNAEDDDCDGRIDDLVLEFYPRSHVSGAAGDWLASDGFALGDLDGDGQNELAIGSGVANGGRGVVLVIETAGFSGWREVRARDVASAVVEPTDSRGLGDLPGELRDHTGDGVADLLVAGLDDGGAAPGWALWPGPVAGSLALADATVGSGFGPMGASSVAAPDLDGDGVAEVAYASPDDDALWIFPIGGGDLGPADAQARIDGSAEERFGESLIAADANGDGYDDLLAGAPDNDEHGPDSGTVWLIPGPIDGSAAAADLSPWRLRGQHPYGRLGDRDSIALGDFLADGAPDLAAGAPETSEVYVLFDVGARSGVDDGASFDLLAGSTALGGLGGTVAAGDVDGDGADDLLMTAESGGYGPALYVVTGFLVTAIEPESHAQAAVTTAASEAVSSVAVGDLDGDGRNETILGVPAWAAGEGSAWFLGQE
jgi:hypothetical protein